MADDIVRLVHPDLPDAVYDAAAAAVPAWQELGWREQSKTPLVKKEKKNG